MSLAAIPRAAFLAAAKLPENATSRNALLRAAGVAGDAEGGQAGEVPHKRSERVREPRTRVVRDEGLDSLSLTLYGAPRTKKNSAARLSNKGKPCIVPSAAWMKWRDQCLKQTNDSMRLRDQPYNLAAVFYRDADKGDLAGYIQAVQDVLQEAGILSNDKWIRSLDRCRLRVDRKRPRVELRLFPASGD